MISFEKFCEEFKYFDSQVARKGTGPSVSSSSLGGIMQRPKPATTGIIGDRTGATGNNVYLVRNVKTPFDFKIKLKDDLYCIYLKYRKDSKYIPLKETKFAATYSCEYPTKDEAVEALRDLKFKISQVDIHNK